MYKQGSLDNTDFSKYQVIVYRYRGVTLETINAICTNTNITTSIFSQK